MKLATHSNKDKNTLIGIMNHSYNGTTVMTSLQQHRARWRTHYYRTRSRTWTITTAVKYPVSPSTARTDFLIVPLLRTQYNYC